MLCAMTARKIKPGSYDDFGFFDGTVEELRAAQSSPGGYEAQQERIAPFVESVLLSGVFEVVREEAGPG